MTSYITEQELRLFLGSGDARDADLLQDAIVTASREVDSLCGRYFSDDGTTSVRYYDAADQWTVNTDDFSTTSGLIVQTDTGYNGTYSTTLTLNTDYFADPVNQRVDAIPFPYLKLTAASSFLSYAFPFPPSVPYSRRPTIKVTARWGWSSVPAPVALATKMLAAEDYKIKDATFGVAGYGEYGSIRVRDNPKIRARLLPYMKTPIASG